MPMVEFPDTSMEVPNPVQADRSTTAVVPVIFVMVFNHAGMEVDPLNVTDVNPVIPAFRVAKAVPAVRVVSAPPAVKLVTVSGKVKSVTVAGTITEVMSDCNPLRSKVVPRPVMLPISNAQEDAV